MAPQRAPCVVVKVLHPDVMNSVEMDLRFLQQCVKIMKFVVPSIEYWDLSGMINEFSSLMTNQLDLRIEAENLRKFRRNFKSKVFGVPKTILRSWRGEVIVRFPHPILASKEVLIETCEGGKPLSKLMEHLQADSLHPFPKDPLHRKRLRYLIAHGGLRVFLKMILLDNFLHADMHPGNILVRMQPSRLCFLPLRERWWQKQEMTKHPHMFRLVKFLFPLRWKCEFTILDAGMVTQLPNDHWKNFFEILFFSRIGRGRNAAAIMIDRAPSHMCSNREVFIEDMNSLIQRAVTNSSQGGGLDMLNFMWDVASMCRHHRVMMESATSTLLNGALIAEGTGKNMHEDVNLFREATTFLVERKLIDLPRHCFDSLWRLLPTKTVRTDGHD
jgi:aarF domain-containing kinase